MSILLRTTIILLICGVFTTYMQAAEFNVYQQIGIDALPPTTPINLNALAVSTSQIDLSWSSSTDLGVGVLGYQVFRDTVQIATTSGLFYSDIGLLGDTQYSYTITAYDVFYNTSSQSATATIQTLGVSVPPNILLNTAGSKTEQVPIQLKITDVITKNSGGYADISFKTNAYAKAIVSFGLTKDYELGSLQNEKYKQEHVFNIQNLSANIRYYYEIKAYNQRGDIVLYEGSFDFKPYIEAGVTPNVSSLAVQVQNNNVMLTWNNPKNYPFEYIRVVANPNSYPGDVVDGFIVYQGIGENAIHTGVFSEYDQMYYTVFVVDALGNTSSGAVTYAGSVENPIALDSEIIPDVVPTGPIFFHDLEFIQNGNLYTDQKIEVALDAFLPFLVRINYDLVPRHLKTILFTIDNQSFLLRANQDKTYYQANIDVLRNYRTYPVVLSVLSYKNATVQRVYGSIVVGPQMQDEYILLTQKTVGEIVFGSLRFWWLWILEFVLLYFAYRLFKERIR